MEAAKLNEELLEQYVLAGSTKAKPEQLRVLAEHFCDKIRLRVAENPVTPAEVLWNLAHDGSHDVRIAVGGNPACDESIFDLLVCDADIVVRHGLAQNIATPRMLLEVLAEDDNGWVRGDALKTLSILDSKAGDELGKQRKLKRSRSRTTTTGHLEKHAQTRKEVAS
jgi:hypothetical protein